MLDKCKELILLTKLMFPNKQFSVCTVINVI